MTCGIYPSGSGIVHGAVKTFYTPCICMFYAKFAAFRRSQSKSPAFCCIFLRTSAEARRFVNLSRIACKGPAGSEPWINPWHFCAPAGEPCQLPFVKARSLVRILWRRLMKESFQPPIIVYWSLYHSNQRLSVASLARDGIWRQLMATPCSVGLFG